MPSMQQVVRVPDALSQLSVSRLRASNSASLNCVSGTNGRPLWPRQYRHHADLRSPPDSPTFKVSY
jgi:hypothetical protein